MGEEIDRGEVGEERERRDREREERDREERDRDTLRERLIHN